MVLRSLFILGVIALVGCESSNSTDASGELEISGKELFKNQCVACHGTDGKLQAAGAKDLSISTLSDEEIQTTVEDGKNTMPPFKYIIGSEQEMDKLLEFVKSLRK